MKQEGSLNVRIGMSLLCLIQCTTKMTKCKLFFKKVKSIVRQLAARVLNSFACTVMVLSINTPRVVPKDILVNKMEAFLLP